MELLGSTKSKIINNENSKKVPYSEIAEVVLIHCNVVNVVNKSYQQKSRILYTFVPNKSFRNDQMLDISLENVIFLKKFDSKFLYTEVWLTGQNYIPLEIEDKMNIAFVIKV